MTVTTTSLIKAAGAAAAAAGAIFIAVQINHPPLDASPPTPPSGWSAASAKVVMAVLALAGITGMYLRQVRQSRRPRARRLPRLRRRLPRHVRRPGHGRVRPARRWPTPSPASSTTSSPRPPAAPRTGDIGTCRSCSTSPGAGYLLGGLIFGIALFRAGVLARWAAALLAVSTVGTAALAVLPGGVQPADGRPRRHRAHRPGRLPVADDQREPRRVPPTRRRVPPRSRRPQSDDHRPATPADATWTPRASGAGRSRPPSSR